MTTASATYSIENNKFIIENYNWAKSFANFFPGIAGKWGIPIWCYYVNRNQGMCSMGVANKDHQIMEFLSFNKAVATVGKVGFRTYLKVDNKIYEPFQKTKNPHIKQKMLVSSSTLEIIDQNEELGLETKVTYSSLVGYKIPALIREVTVKNLNGQRTTDNGLRIELIDGLPHIFPYGVDIGIIQTTPRHIEGMMKVDDYKGVPLFRLKQTPQDVEQVAKLEGGNFWFSVKQGESKPLTEGLIVDPTILYAEAENYDYPWVFEERSLDSILDQKQIKQNRTPSAFTTATLDLAPGEKTTLVSFLGYTKTDEGLDILLEDLKKESFLENKKKENVEVVEKIKQKSFTLTSSPAFNEYSQQTFLDNVIRGGMPMTFDTASGKSAFYLYSRQNGDIERDYHYFVIEPTYMSQGTGHYRSILQNRRCDSWFFPEIEDYNIKLYMNLTQLDGFSPLEVLGTTYRVKDVDKADQWVKNVITDPEKQSFFKDMIKDKFTPGEFIMAMEDKGLASEQSYEEVLQGLLSFCEENEVGDRLHLGFWIDHWCYNLDTIETYLMNYPDRVKELLIDKKQYSFYDNPDQVKPRDEKYVFANGKVHQYDAVVYDKEKDSFLKKREHFKNRVRTEYGKGSVYQTNLCVKLLCHIANRIATLDPHNAGVEMEANKPGWNDSMSAIAGIFGASLCHTFEIERASQMLLKALGESGIDDTIAVYEELAHLISALNEKLEKRLSSQDDNKRFIYWDESHSLKEDYRNTTKYGVKGSEKEMSLSVVEAFLKNCVALVQDLYKKENKHLAFNDQGIPYTYLTYEVPEFDYLKDDQGNNKLSSQGYACVQPKSFKVKPIALFLEGPVHYLRVHPEKAQETCAAIKESNLYDKKLKMYKVCESLKDETFEIGRVHAWGSGWIENESIYTHMETKYLLELIKCEQYDEFYSALQTGIPCFFDPQVYGRSVFENVSFIVSSAFVDEKMHGQGLQARLSGVTNEMIHVWVLMMAGKEPLFLDSKGALSFKLEPKLPEWLFTKKEQSVSCYDGENNLQNMTVPENSVAFKLFGKTLVTYENPQRKNTYGENSAKIQNYKLTYWDGSEKIVEGAVVSGKAAHDVREGKIKNIEVVLA